MVGVIRSGHAALLFRSYASLFRLRKSPASRCLDLGNIDLFHLHHCLERTLCFAAANRKRFR
jgi:hypothetical protein